MKTTKQCEGCGCQVQACEVLGFARRYCNDCAIKLEEEYQAKQMAGRVTRALKGVITQREFAKLNKINMQLPDAMHDVIKGYRNPDARKWILLHGQTGVGKTTMMHAFALRCAQQHHEHPPTMMYVTEPEIMAELKQFEFTYKHFSKVGVLLVDELGLSRGSEYEWRQWSAIIDDRYRHGCITVMGSNLNPDQLASHPMFGARTMRRINEMAGEDGIIKLTGDFNDK